MIYGVDVSSYQGAYPWADGEAFGFCKATEGTFYQDAAFASNWMVMGSKRILRGAYHFAHPGSNAKAQAAYFVAYVESHGLETLDVLALDLEVSDGLSAAAAAAWANEFVSAVEASTGKNVWVYTTFSFISGGYCDGLYKHPLWIADPAAAAGTVSRSVKPFPVWTVQQVSGVTSPHGVDVLNGGSAVWSALVNMIEPAAKFKTVTASWTCEGAESLTGLCASLFDGTAVSGVQASTVLRLTLDNSHDQLFAADLAAYISAGDLASRPVPTGVVLFYPKKVKV
jgi:lysozyme